MENYIVIYAIVPKHIYETKLLTPEEKLIAERIIYLCKKEGYCWITNKKLSEMYNITIETASRHIKKLERIGLIKCIYDHNDKNTRRVIQLVDDIWTNWSTRDKSNNQEDIDYSIKHNNKYNNINIIVIKLINHQFLGGLMKILNLNLLLLKNKLKWKE